MVLVRQDWSLMNVAIKEESQKHWDPIMYKVSLKAIFPIRTNSVLQAIPTGNFFSEPWLQFPERIGKNAEEE